MVVGIHPSPAQQLRFGTAGIRAAVGPAAHQMNVAQVARVTHATAAWLIEHAPAKDPSTSLGELAATRDPESRRFGVGASLHNESAAPRIVVGYDSRYGSHVFATTAAEVFAGAGCEVLMYPMPTPTPMVPWLIKSWGLDGGVQITASHNPAGDNGYKVFTAQGRLLPAGAEKDVEELLRTAPEAKDIPRVTVRPCPDYMRRYIDDVTNLVLPDGADLLATNNARAGLVVAFTAMHGVGGRALHNALQVAGFAQVYPVMSQLFPDPTFPSVHFPSPEEAPAVAQLLEHGEEVQADIVVALDPDADRCAIGIRGPEGLRMLSGDEAGVLLAHHLLPEHQVSIDSPAPAPIVATTYVSTEMFTALAKERGWDLRLTPTGFKNLTAVGGEHTSVDYAFEEAVGIAPAPHLVDDKDGIITALVACAWAAELKAQGTSLADELSALKRECGFFDNRQIAARTAHPASLMDALTRALIDRLAHWGVEPHPAPAPHMVVLRGQEPGGARVRVIARRSGTEPKVKIYVEVSHTPSAQEARRFLGEACGAIERVLDGI